MIFMLPLMFITASSKTYNSNNNNMAYVHESDNYVSLTLRTLNSQAEEPVRLKKHKVIAQAFAKRKTFNKAGRLSLSFHSTHEDPVGKLFYHFLTE